ncbi:unnamed protein product, partial [Polarella glacialis]
AWQGLSTPLGNSQNEAVELRLRDAEAALRQAADGVADLEARVQGEERVYWTVVQALEQRVGFLEEAWESRQGLEPGLGAAVEQRLAAVEAETTKLLRRLMVPRDPASTIVQDPAARRRGPPSSGPPTPRIDRSSATSAPSSAKKQMPCSRSPDPWALNGGTREPVAVQPVEAEAEAHSTESQGPLLLESPPQTQLSDHQEQSFRESRSLWSDRS